MEHQPFNDWDAEESRPKLDLKILVLYGAFRSKFWIVVLASLGLIGGLLSGASTPNVYESSATLHYRAGMQEALTEENLLGVTPDSHRLSAPGINDEVMLLSDPKIFEDLVKEKGCDYVLRPEDPTRFDNDQTSLPVRIMHRLQSFLQAHGRSDAGDDPGRVRWTARYVQRQTEIQPIRGTSYIRVVHRARSANKAREFCEWLIRAFVERHQEEYGVSGEKSEEQKESVQLALEEFQRRDAAYREFRSSCGVYDYDTESEENRRTLVRIRDDLRNRQGELKKANAAIKILEETLLEMPAMIEQHADAVVQQNPAYKRLQDELGRLTLEEIQNQTRPQSDQLREEKQQRIAEQRRLIREELDGMDHMIEVQPERVETVVNEGHIQLKTQLVEKQIERDALIAEIEELEASRDEQLDRRTLIGECRDKHFYHSDRVAEAEVEYDEQADWLARLRKLALREEAGGSNLKIHQEARMPLAKVGPNRWKPLALGLVAGLAFGLGVAVLRQLLDRHLRYPETIEKGLGVKVLGVVPETRRLKSFPKSAPAA